MNDSHVIIICVDNAEFRHKYYKIAYHHGSVYNKNLYTIDCGNGKNFGQVILTDAQKTLKNPFEIFPDMLEQDTAETQGIDGCSYRESLEKQDLFINDLLAVEAVQILWKLFREDEININGIIYNGTKSKMLPIKQ